MKTKRHKKDLRKRLSAITSIYIDGLDGKKKKKFEKYLDSKLKDVVEYYMLLLKKKDRKNHSLITQSNEESLVSPGGGGAKINHIDTAHETNDIVKDQVLLQNADQSAAAERETFPEQDIVSVEED